MLGNKMADTSLLDLFESQGDYRTIVKQLNSIENRRFIVDNKKNAIHLTGHGMGFQGDDLYCRWNAMIKNNRNGDYEIDMDSTLYSRNRDKSTVYSQYGIEDQFNDKLIFNSEDEVVDFFTTKNLNNYFRKKHDWVYYIIG